MGRFETIGRGLSFDDRLGFEHFEDDLFGHSHAKRGLFVKFDADHHAVRQIGPIVADKVALQFDLLEAFRIHEGEAVIIAKQELVVLLFEANFLDRFRGAEAFIQLRAIDQIAQLDLIERAALSGFYRIGLHGTPDPALMLDYIAGFDLVSIDLGHLENPLSL